MPKVDIIDDDEWFYRSFPVPDHRQDGAVHYEVIDGQLRLSRGVWNDRHLQPSVDRKKLISSPQDVKFNEHDAIVKIQAREVRDISVKSEGRGHDVIFDPLDERPAHSLIFTEPSFSLKPNSEKDKWKKFQMLLSLAATKHGWVVAPQ